MTNGSFLQNETGPQVEMRPFKQFIEQHSFYRYKSDFKQFIINHEVCLGSLNPDRLTRLAEERFVAVCFFSSYPIRQKILVIEFIIFNVALLCKQKLYSPEIGPLYPGNRHLSDLDTNISIDKPIAKYYAAGYN